MGDAGDAPAGSDLLNRGLTLTESWRLAAAIFGPPVCVLAAGRRRVDVTEIPKTPMMAPEQLVMALTRALTLGPEVCLSAFVTDGQMAHAVVLSGYDAANDAIVFIDPWKPRSLLCRENNVAGVDAQPRPDETWSVRSGELARVLFAVFIDPPVWAELNAEPYRLTYPNFQKTAFYAFPSVSERERRTVSAPRNERRTLIVLQPGDARDAVELEVEVDERDEVRLGRLRLRRHRVTPHGINPRALQITASFRTHHHSGARSREFRRTLKRLRLHRRSKQHSAAPRLSRRRSGRAVIASVSRRV